MPVPKTFSLMLSFTTHKQIISLASTVNFQVFIHYTYRLYLSSHCDIMTYKKYMFVLHDDFGVWSLKAIHFNSTEIEMKLIITTYIPIHVCVEEGHGNKM